MEDPMELPEMKDFKMNWLALWTVIVSLIIIGWCLGAIVNPAEPEILQCPAEDWVQIAGAVDHVVIYCEPPATN